MLSSLLRFALRTVYRPWLRGELGALAQQGIVIVSNHPSALDALLLAVFLPVRCKVAVGPSDGGSRLARWALRCIDHVVCDMSDPHAVKRLLRLLAAGERLVLFPEGRVSRTGALMKLYDVAALVAGKCPGGVVPVHIGGGGLASGPGLKGRSRWRSRVTLTVHAAAQIRVSPALPARSRRRESARALLEIMEYAAFASRPHCSVFTALLDAARAQGPGTRVLEDVQGEKSYRRIVLDSLALGRLVSRLSAEREIVGVLLPNIAITVCLLLGMCATRRIPAMLNYSAGPGTVAKACATSGIRRVITSRKFVQGARLHATVEALGAIELVYLEDLRSEFGFADRLWLMAYAYWLPRRALPPVAAEDTAIVLFTSGSEGSPKGVALSHAALLANIAQITAVIDVHTEDKFLSALPLYHTYGLTACTLLPLLSGARLFLYTNPLHYRIIPEIAYSRDCTYVFGTSTFLAHYARQARTEDFSSVRYVISGGEKLDAEVARTWLEKFGLRIIEGYGATECGPAMTLNSPHAYRPGSVGRFLPGIEHRVIRVPGLPRGGALHVRGPNLMLGYYLPDQPGELQPPRSDLGAGWFATGDMVEIEDGFVFMLGRVRRFAKIAGEMVSLELVERIAVRASPEHRHAAIVHTQPDRGESTILFTTDAGLDRIRLHRAAVELGSQELAVARRIVHVDEVPLLGSGKTDYPALGTLMQSGLRVQADGAEPASPRPRLASVQSPPLA